MKIMPIETEPPQTIITSPSSSSPQSECDELDGATLKIVGPRSSSPVATRPSYARVVSPLQHSFTPRQGDDIAAMPRCTDTATRSFRATGDVKRGRGMSRSSSVPSTIHLSVSQKRNNDRSPPSQSVTPEPSSSIQNETRHNTSSVKHMTCFWWKTKGICRYTDEDCLYAHYDTGHYADAPRQIIPGEPALAGRKLERAMRNWSWATQRSSGSLNSVAGSRHTSRPGTPVLSVDYSTASNIGSSSPITSPTAFHAPYGIEVDIARLTSDNHFLRTLVDQNGKEKAVMISTIEALQADNKSMKCEMEGLRNAQAQLLIEREGLHSRIQKLDENLSDKLTLARSVSNPFGAIGRARVNTETHYIGGLLSDDH